MERLSEAAKRMLFWGALSLVVWAAWELSVRIDAMSRPIGMYVNMAVGERIGFFRALSYVDWKILETPGFLLGMVVLGLLSLRSRRRAGLSLLVVPLCVAAALYTVGAKALFSGNLWHMIKLLPLLLIVLGSVLNLVVYRRVRDRYRGTGDHTGPGVRKFGQDKSPFQ